VTQRPREKKEREKKREKMEREREKNMGDEVRWVSIPNYLSHYHNSFVLCWTVPGYDKALTDSLIDNKELKQKQIMQSEQAGSISPPKIMNSKRERKWRVKKMRDMKKRAQRERERWKKRKRVKEKRGVGSMWGCSW